MRGKSVACNSDEGKPCRCSGTAAKSRVGAKSSFGEKHNAQLLSMYLVLSMSGLRSNSGSAPHAGDMSAVAALDRVGNIPVIVSSNSWKLATGNRNNNNSIREMRVDSSAT